MAFFNGFKKTFAKLSWRNSIQAGLDKEEISIRTRILPELENLLSKLDTNIPVSYERIDEGSTVSFRIGPIEGPSFIRDTDGATILTSDLFKWLNEGTSERNVKIIGDYQNETFPNSLRTQSVDNSDVVMYASKKFRYPGIEARNWIPLLRDKYQTEIERSFLSGLKQFLLGK